jgi:hypothetical protein
MGISIYNLEVEPTPSHHQQRDAAQGIMQESSTSDFCCDLPARRGRSASGGQSCGSTCRHGGTGAMMWVHGAVDGLL